MGDLATRLEDSYDGFVHVSVLAYNGCLGAEVMGFSDVLLVANRVHRMSHPRGPSPFEVAVIGVRGGMVDVAGGVRLCVQRPPTRTDLLVVPAFDFARIDDLGAVMHFLAPELRFIARASERHPLAAICGGTFLLAEAGVLDGRRATTAWAFTAELARLYPAVKVEEDAVLVRDRDVVTTGAFSAFGDLGLHLIREHVGAALARAVARLTLLDSGRDSQAPYRDARLARLHRPPFSSAVTRWLELRLNERYDLERVARAHHVSSRTLLRRFKAETGNTPLEQLHALRIERAKRLLESTTLGIPEIAEHVGYVDPATFSRLFARKASVTPGAYRRRFRSARRDVSARSRSSSTHH